ncbi:MAG: hypothetical protein ACQER9_00095 [Nanobdellota archaeon]
MKSKRSQTTLVVNITFGVIFVIAVFFAYLFIDHEFKKLKDMEIIEFQEIDSASAYISTLKEADKDAVKDLISINKKIIDNMVESDTAEGRQKDRIKYYKTFRNEIGKESNADFSPEYWVLRYYPLIKDNELELFVPATLFFGKGKDPYELDCSNFGEAGIYTWNPSVNPNLQISTFYKEYCKLMVLKK